LPGPSASSMTIRFALFSHSIARSMSGLEPVTPSRISRTAAPVAELAGRERRVGALEVLRPVAEDEIAFVAAQLASATRPVLVSSSLSKIPSITLGLSANSASGPSACRYLKGAS